MHDIHYKVAFTVMTFAKPFFTSHLEHERSKGSFEQIHNI